MKRITGVIIALVASMFGAVCGFVAHGQSEAQLEAAAAQYRGRPVFHGKYHFVDAQGDTCLMLVFNELTVYPAKKFKNKKEEEAYWRTVRDVRRTLPYAKMICETLIETYEYIETFPTQAERERHLKQMEKELFDQYKPVLRKFSRRQARVLVKLIQRETDQSSYQIVKAFLGTARATFWQGFGRLFGVNLKADYRPEKNKEDAELERIAVLIEQGSL